MATPKIAKKQTGSEIVKALEALWTSIRKRHPELPDVVIITGSAISNGMAWAHFWRERWEDRSDATKRPEMFISGERLACGAELALQSMLHEAAHALAFIRDEQDTSRQNRYHNMIFVKMAEEMGLEYPHLNEKGKPNPDATIGFSAVVLKDETKVMYKAEIDKLDSAIKIYLNDPMFLGLAGLGNGGSGTTGTINIGTGGDGTHRIAKRGTLKPTTPSRNNVKYVCDCDKPRVMRMAPSTFEIAPIICGDCEKDFHESF